MKHLVLAGLGAIVVGCASPNAISPGPVRRLRPAADERVVLDHLLVLVDASSSLGEYSEFADARALLRRYAASLPDGDYEAGAVAFGGKARRRLPLAPFDRARFEASVAETPHLQQGTPLHEVLDEAYGSLLRRRGRGAVVIFSDGLVTDALGGAVAPGRTAAAARALADAYDGELCFHTVQLGSSEEGERELRAISEATECGSYRTAEANEPESWLHAFHREVLLGNAILPVVAAPTAQPAPREVWRLNFDVDSAEVDPLYRSRLDEIAAAMRADPGARLVVHGHTDSTGTVDHNDSLSMRRSEAARDALIRAGVDAGRIDLRGHGAGVPVAPNVDDEGRRENRRTEIEIVR